MGIREVAEASRLRFRLDDCRDPIIPGRYGHLYEHSDTQLGVCLEHPVSSSKTNRFMRHRLRVLSDLVGKARQEGDSEGTWTLPIDIASKVPLFAQVLKMAGIRKIRQASGRPFQRRLL